MSTPPALTTLTEEESMFRDAVRDFAEGEIRPLSKAMEEAGRYDETILPKLFEMGVKLAKDFSPLTSEEEKTLKAKAAEGTPLFRYPSPDA